MFLIDIKYYCGYFKNYSLFVAKNVYTKYLFWAPFRQDTKYNHLVKNLLVFIKIIFDLFIPGAHQALIIIYALQFLMVTGGATERKKKHSHILKFNTEVMWTLNEAQGEFRLELWE